MEERDGFLAAPDNLRIYWQAIRPSEPRGTVALLHGYGEYAGRYRRLMGALAEAGYEVFALDFRGHGQADGRRGHCDHFAEYLGDLDTFVQHVRASASTSRLFLFGHSHGGLVLSRWLIERNPQDVAGVVFSSPYLKLAFAPPRMKVTAARLLGRVVPWAPVSTGLRSDQLTRDPEEQAKVDRDPLYNRNATPRWYLEMGEAQAVVEARAKEIGLPTLVLFGTDDPIADVAEGRRFFSALGAEDKTLREYEGARHELFNELPDVRENVTADLIAWLDQHAREGAV